MLLHVADKARQWPNLKKLEMAALVELEKLQIDFVEQQPVPPTADVPRRMRPSTTGDRE